MNYDDKRSDTQIFTPKAKIGDLSVITTQSKYVLNTQSKYVLNTQSKYDLTRKFFDNLSSALKLGRSIP